LETDYIYAEHLLSIWSYFDLKTTAYAKWLSSVRMHEINTRNYTTSFNPEPWFTNHQVNTIGFEQSVIWQQAYKTAMLSYTWSKTELQNEEINNGTAFPAYWDRTHQIKATWQQQLSENWSYALSGLAASGLPAREPGSVGNITERLDWYKRMDASLSWKKYSSLFQYEIKLSVYNLLNTKNPWYREEVQAFNSLADNADIITVQADVLDFRFLPSFDVRISW
jgi:hypothetical protein